MENLRLIDIKILEIFTIKIKNRFLDIIMPIISHSNDYGLILLVLIAVSLITGYRTDLALKSGIALSLGVLFGEIILKKTIQRLRPVLEHLGLEQSTKLPKSSSFPSGHTTSAFAVYTVLLGAGYEFSWIFLIFALVIGFSRIYLGVHYPSDVLGGIILGLFCGWLALGIYVWLDIELLRSFGIFSGLLYSG